MSLEIIHECNAQGCRQDAEECYCSGCIEEMRKEAYEEGFVAGKEYVSE